MVRAPGRGDVSPPEPLHCPIALAQGTPCVLCPAHQAKSHMSFSLLPYYDGFHSIYLWSSLQFCHHFYHFSIFLGCLCPSFFFSLLAGFHSHQQVHLHFFTMMCPTLSVTFPLAHYRTLCISISLCLIILHFFFATSP